MNFAPFVTDALRLEWSSSASDRNATYFDRTLARVQLLAADGDIAKAQRILRQCLRGSPTVSNRYGGRFHVVLAALRCRDLSTISRFLTRSTGKAPIIELALQDPNTSPRNQNTFLCTISAASWLRFEMPYSAYISQHLPFLVSRWLATLPMFEHCFAAGNLRQGEIALNVGDFGRVPGLAFCANSDAYLLVPDSEFLKSYGYEHVRTHFAVNPIPWNARRQVAFWRGATTGIEDPKIGWKSKPRMKLCQITRDTSPELFDVGISRLELLPNHPGRSEIPQTDLMRPHVSVTQFQAYRYQIDIDGHTSAWGGLFQKLLTGCPVLKVESAQGWRQWYYDRLVAWENFVPVEASMADLVEKVHWLIGHDDIAQRIGQAGRALADSLSFSAEVAAGAATIGKALQG